MLQLRARYFRLQMVKFSFGAVRYAIPFRSGENPDT
jgi:hypothetical protein